MAPFFFQRNSDWAACCVFKENFVSDIQKAEELEVFALAASKKEEENLAWSLRLELTPFSFVFWPWALRVVFKKKKQEGRRTKEGDLIFILSSSSLFFCPIGGFEKKNSSSSLC